MREFIKTQTTDHIAYIGHKQGGSNEIKLEMVGELVTELEEAKENPSGEAVLIDCNEGFFSSGLDLITLYDYDEETIRRFWERFLDLIYDLIAFPKPLIASVTGHSPAGGCVLAICCDYRVMAEGQYIFGLNEVAIGVPVPTSIFSLYSLWIGQAEAYRSLLAGKLFSPSEALLIHLVDEVVPANRIHTVATQKAKAFMQFEKNAWATTKNNLRKALLQEIQQDKALAAQQQLEQWWKPSTRSILKTIIDNLTQKKA